MVNVALAMKTGIPPLPAHYVVRPRLAEVLAKGIKGPVTFVIAPIGYGKASLVSAWHLSPHGTDTPLAWASLDEGDDNPDRMLALIAHALAPVYNDKDLERAADTSEVFDALLAADERAIRDVVVCLEGYNYIRSESTRTTVLYLLEHCLRHTHWVVLGCEDPDLSILLLKERGHVTDITEADLRFTEQEACQLFRSQLGEQPALANMAAVMSYTEGWPAALRFEALAAQKNPCIMRSDHTWKPQDQQAVYRLFEKMLSRQSAEVWYFLQITSILDRLCLPLCEALLKACPPPVCESGEDVFAMSVQQLLEELQRAHLFVEPVQNNEHWLRCRSPFRAFLLERLKATYPDRIADLHRTASAWFMARSYQQKFLTEAIRHLTLAGEWEQAACLAERYGMETLVRGDLGAVSAWLASLPQSVMDGHPALRFMYLYANYGRVGSGERSFLKSYVSAAEASAPGAGEEESSASPPLNPQYLFGPLMDTLPDPNLDAEKVVCAAESILEHMNDKDAMYSSFLLTAGFGHAAAYDVPGALKLYEQGRQAAQAIGAQLDAVCVDYYEVQMAIDCGQVRKALKLCQQAQARYRFVSSEMNVPPAVEGLIDVAYGSILTEQHRLDEAEAVLVCGEQRVQQLSISHFHVDSLVELYRLRIAQGRLDEALHTLDRLQVAWPDYAFLAEILREETYGTVFPEGESTSRSLHGGTSTLNALHEGEFSPLDSTDQPHTPGMGPIGGSSVYFRVYLSWARLQTFSGHPERALAYLDAHILLCDQHGINGRLIQLLVEKALALAALDRSKQAALALRRALELAQPEGYVQVFNGGPRLDALLVRAATTRETRTYVTYLQSCFKRSGVGAAATLARAAVSTDAVIPVDDVTSAAPTDTVGALSLSERETEILRLVAQGLVNKEVAYRLHVQTGTVKVHMTSIMRKLGVSNRTQAVLQARKHGLDI